MARPIKCRRVCSLPKVSRFSPCGRSCAESVLMSVEEYESIRLIDLMDYSQEDAAGYMNVARTTVQSIYMSARRKLARCLVEGLTLKIEGGNYKLCDRKGCCRNCHVKRDENEDSTSCR